MQTQPLHFFSFKNRKASALIGTLVMVGILAMAVGVMLSSSSQVIRGSRDKILYEEAYQAALSGTHVARAWMIDSQLVGAVTGDETLEGEIAALVNRGLNMNDQIIFDRERNKTTDLYGTARYDEAGLTLGEELDDGRRVVYEFPSDSPVVTFINDKNDKNFGDSLFQGTPEKGHRNYVDRIRITTPPHDPSTTSVSLLETTFVIESTGVAEYAGTRKERVVHQRILLYPKQPGGALMSAGEAVLTKQGITIQGKSHANIHWAPVMAKENIALEFLNPLVRTNNANGTVSWNLTTKNGDGKKFNGAGIYTTDPNFPTGVNEMDKWLRWMAGSEGQITASDGLNIFSQVVPVLNPNPITNPTGLITGVDDFFGQVQEGVFAAAPNYLSPSSLTLGGQYAVSGTTMVNPNGLYNETADGFTGGLVQGSDDVDTLVDSFFDTMNYLELKEYAKAHNGYYTYDGTTIRDATGRVTTMPDMKPQVESGFDPLGETAVNDRILFVDSLADANSSEPNNPFTTSLKLPDFWKGVMYINGNVYSTGTGASPNVQTRTPDQFKTFRDEQVSGTHLVKNVLVDGILICNGVADLGGNTAIYGTLAALGGVGLGGTPSIFYNSANGEGRMKGDLSQSADFRLIAGKLYEE